MSTTTSSSIDADSIQKCLYTWEPASDPFAGVLDSQQTQAIRDALLDAFSQTKTVEQRGIDTLQKPLKLIDELLHTPGASSWSDSEHIMLIGLDEFIYVRQQTMLALRHQLQWILDTFQHGPQISVTVR